MTKITNTVGSPFDVQTLSGPAVLPAFGSVEAEFDPTYLEILCAGGVVVVDESKTAKDEDDLSALQSEYAELAGKNADKRWQAERLAAEIEKLKG